jgi:hypothetical protein
MVAAPLADPQYIWDGAALIVVYGDGKWRIDPAAFDDAELAVSDPAPSKERRIEIYRRKIPGRPREITTFAGTNLKAPVWIRIHLLDGEWKADVRIIGTGQTSKLIDWCRGTAIQDGYESLELKLAGKEVAEFRDAKFQANSKFEIEFRARDKPIDVKMGRYSGEAAILRLIPPTSAEGGGPSLPQGAVRQCRLEFGAEGVAVGDSGRIRIGQAGSQDLSLMAEKPATLLLDSYKLAGASDAIGLLSGETGALRVTWSEVVGGAYGLRLDKWSVQSQLSDWGAKCRFSLTIAEKVHFIRGRRFVAGVTGRDRPLVVLDSDKLPSRLTIPAYLVELHVPLSPAVSQPSRCYADFRRTSGGVMPDPGFLPRLMTGVVGVEAEIHIGNPPNTVAPAAGRAVLRLGTKELAEADLGRARLRLRRAIDGLDLAYSFVGYAVQITQAKAQIVPFAAPEARYQIVHFWPQHVSEEVFERKEAVGVAARLGVSRLAKPKATAVAPAARIIDDLKPEAYASGLTTYLARTRASGPTRLVFKRPENPPVPIPLTIEALTDWSRLQLQVSRRAAARNMDLDSQMKDIARIDLKASRDQALAAIKASFGWDDKHPDGGLDENDTVLELVTGLAFSPDATARFEISRPPTSEAVAEQWSARLVTTASGAVRAIWAPDLDMRIFGPAPGPGDLDNDDRAPFTSALTRKDRRQIVMLTSAFGLPMRRALVPDPQKPTVFKDRDDSLVGLPERDDWAYLRSTPEASQPPLPAMRQEGVMSPPPFELFDARLTAFGADTNIEWKGEPPAPYSANSYPSFVAQAFSVQRYQHRTRGGRDSAVRVEYKGFLFPLGVRATLIKVVRREAVLVKDLGWIFPLVVRHFVLPSNKEKAFTGPYHPFEARDFHATGIRMVTKATPFLDPKSTTNVAGITQGFAFWVRVNNADFGFEYEDLEAKGRRRSPALFVDNIVINEPASMAKVVDYYNRLPWGFDAQEGQEGARRTERIDGGEVIFAPAARLGDTSFPGDRAILAARGRVPKGDGQAQGSFYYDMDAFMEGADQPPFYPFLDRARISIPSLERLTGTARPAVVTYHSAYRSQGFDPRANPSEIYLSCLSPDVSLELGARGESTGGVARPDAPLAAVSRTTGLIGGRLKPPGAVALQRTTTTDAQFDISAAEAGQFDPSQFFKGAKLLGIVPLDLVVKAAGIAAAPKMRELMEIAAPDKATAARIAQQLRAAEDAMGKAYGAADSAIKEKVTGYEFKSFYPELATSITDFRAQILAAASEIEASGPQQPTGYVAAATRLAQAWPPFNASLKQFARDPTPALLKDALISFKNFADNLRGRLGSALLTALSTALKTVSLELLIDALARARVLETILGPVAGDELAREFPAPPPIEAMLTLPDQRLSEEQARRLLKSIVDDPRGFAASLETGIAGRWLGQPLFELLLALSELSAEGPVIAWPLRQVADRMAAALRMAVAQAKLTAQETADLGVLQHRLVAATVHRAADRVGAALRQGGVPPISDPAALKLWIEERLRTLPNALSSILDELLKDIPAAIRALGAGGPIARQWAEARSKLQQKLQTALSSPERRRLEARLREAAAMIEEIERRRRGLAALEKTLSAESAAKMATRMIEAGERALLAAAHDLAANLDRKLDARLAELLVATTQFVERWGTTARQAQTLGDKWCESATGPHAVAKALATSLAPDSALLIAAIDKAAGLSAELDTLSVGQKPGIDAFRNAAAGVRTEVQRLRSAVLRMEAVRSAFAASTTVSICAERGRPLEALNRLMVDWREAAKVTSNLVDQVDAAGAAATPDVAKLAGAKLKELRTLIGLVATGLLARVDAGWTTQVSQFAAQLPADQRNRLTDAVEALRKRVDALKAGPKPETLASYADEVLAALGGTLGDLLGILLSYGTMAGDLACQASSACEGLAKALLEIIQPPALHAELAVTRLRTELSQQQGELAPLVALLGGRLLSELSAAHALLKEDREKIDAAITSTDKFGAVGALFERWKKAPPGIVLAWRLLEQLVDAILTGQLTRFVDFDSARKALEGALRDLVPARATIEYDWSTELSGYPSSDPIFQMDRGASGAGGGGAGDLVISSRAEINLLPPHDRQFVAKGHLGPFMIRLLGERFDLVTIRFSGASFESRTGQKTTFKADVSGVTIGPMLRFLDALAPFMGGRPENGPYVVPSFSPLGIEAGYRFAADVIQVGSLSFLNVDLTVAALLPFEPKQAEFRFIFASRARPFIITSPPYGGGGFVALHATGKGIARFELQVEFGAVVALRFGPFRGHGLVTAGLYMLASPEGRRLEGFVHAVGEGSIACFSLTLNIEVLVRHNSDGSMNGESTYRVTFRIGPAKYRYSVTARYKIKGGKGGGSKALEQGSPNLDWAELARAGNTIVVCGPDRSDWLQYRQNFAEGW